MQVHDNERDMLSFRCGSTSSAHIAGAITYSLIGGALRAARCLSRPT